MLTIHGTVLNVLRREPRPGSASSFEPYGQVQLQTVERLDDGQDKIGLQTLGFELRDFPAFEAARGRDVALPVRAYVGKSGLAFSLQPGAGQALQRPPVAAE